MAFPFFVFCRTDIGNDIGVSANDEPDLIFELKYCRQAAGMSPMLYKTFRKYMIWDSNIKPSLIVISNVLLL